MASGFTGRMMGTVGEPTLGAWADAGLGESGPVNATSHEAPQF
jgi:hypothetical protein